jgi:hypothetical protein
MMKKIERHDAENLYADWIVEKGNPHYFIYKWICSWDNWDLAEQMQELMGEEFEIVEE